MKCGSLKRGMRGSELSTRGFIPWFGLPQRRPCIHIVEALTKSIASGNQVSSVNTITVTLIPISTKGDCPRRRGLRPPHNVVNTTPHKVGGSLTCQRATKDPRRPAHRDTRMVHFRTTTQGSKPYLMTHSRANLALTLTKLVLRTKDLISMLLDGLEVFLDVCDVLRLQQPSNGRGEAYI